MITTFFKGDDNEYKKYLNRRNELLLAFLHANSINNIRIIGNAENPLIVYKDEYRLACYVSGMHLILLNKINGEVLSSLTLNALKVIDAESLLLDFIETSGHGKIWKIQLKSTPGLFLTGYNYLDKTTKEGKYPVFAVFEPRIYINKENVQHAIKEFADYKLEIC